MTDRQLSDRALVTGCVVICAFAGFGVLALAAIGLWVVLS